MDTVSNDKTAEEYVVALSGGFDPPMRGHVAMIQDALEFGGVVIILNSDEWCAKNRWSGKAFLPFAKRRDILLGIPGVISVTPAIDGDGTVCENIRALKPDFFGNGGGRTMKNTPEVDVCRELGVGMLWFLGHTENSEHEDMLKVAVLEANGIGIG